MVFPASRKQAEVNFRVFPVRLLWIYVPSASIYASDTAYRRRYANTERRKGRCRGIAIYGSSRIYDAGLSRFQVFLPRRGHANNRISSYCTRTRRRSAT